MSAEDGNSAASGTLGCLLRLQRGKASADGAICTSCAASGAKFEKGIHMLKAVGWIVLIIFIIGLLVVLGVFKAIF